MYYIRFLKAPKIIRGKGDDTKRLACLICLATDLGDSFFPARVLIEANLNCSGKHVDLKDQRRTSIWEAGMRSLRFEFDLGALKPGQSLQVHVTAVGPEAQSVPGALKASSLENVPPIHAAWSIPFEAARQQEAVRRVVRISVSGKRQLSICEDTGESIARHVWDAGVILTEIFLRQMTVLPSVQRVLKDAGDQRLDVIELGSGCGIVGLGLAQAFANCNVVLTDLADAKEIATSNIARLTPALGSTVKFRALDWDEAVPTEIGQQNFDLILISDCTYNASSLPALVQTLGSLMRDSPDALIVVAMKMRHPSEEVFFDLMNSIKLSVIEKVTIPVPQAKACERLEAAEKVDIYIYNAQGVSI